MWRLMTSFKITACFWMNVCGSHRKADGYIFDQIIAWIFASMRIA